MEGSCLCGTVKFILSISPTRFYRCHCSLCRKQTGVGFNLATVVKQADFQWLSGFEKISSWTRASGYRNDFCSCCGTTVPNPLRGSPYVWLPIGLLDNDNAMSCIGDYCINDAMPWDTTRSGVTHAGPVSSLKQLLLCLDV